MDKGAEPMIMQPTTWKSIIWAWPEAPALSLSLNTRRCCCPQPLPGFRGLSACRRFQLLACLHVMAIFPLPAALFPGTPESMKDEK